MNQNWGRVLGSLGILALFAFGSATAGAQMPEAKEKPPMYTYVASWGIARAQWGDFEKQTAANQKVMEKALADGALIGYGSDQNLIHQQDGDTHDNWFSSMSMAGLLNTLDQLYKSGSPTTPVMANAARHSDALYVSRAYNWHAGSWKEIYTRVGLYKLKADAPDDAIDKLSKNVFVPLLEKMMAEGVIHEYEIDVEAIHTEAPGSFAIAYLAANAEALDKVNAAIRDTMRANPMYGPAFGSVVDSNAHRDFLLRSNATYK